MAAVDAGAGVIVSALSTVFFYDVMFWDPDHSLPLVVLWLVIGSIFLTFRMGFINFRAFKHAINVTRGKYSDPADAGEVTHFQALAAALSATVGLGNIAGVAIAVSIGGPGATFWMIIAGLIGMTAKFTECTLGQKYREFRPDGRVMGGAMYYLSKGLGEMGMAEARQGARRDLRDPLHRRLARRRQHLPGQPVAERRAGDRCPGCWRSPGSTAWSWRRWSASSSSAASSASPQVAEKIVPSCAASMSLAALCILFDELRADSRRVRHDLQRRLHARGRLRRLHRRAGHGLPRAAFSNEAGVGSAAIAHSAARTPYPVREGIVALLEPFIDTVVVCTMTALVIVITGAYNNPAYADIIAGSQGAALTSRAMGEHITWFPYILSVGVLLFAFSTMISWSYYGERCWTLPLRRRLLARRSRSCSSSSPSSARSSRRRTCSTSAT